MDEDFLREEPPETLYLRITEQCNLACTYCMVNAGTSRKVMDMDTVKKALDEASAWGSPFVHFSGGEPLLHPDFPSILNEAQKKGFDIGLATNGLLLTEAMVEQLSQVSLNACLINIEGEKGVHDTLRGKAGAYESALRAFHLLEAHGLISTVIIATVLTTENYENVFDLTKMLEDYPIKEYRLATLMPAGRAKNNTLPMKKKDWEAFIYGILPHLLENRLTVKLSFPYMLFFQILKNVGFSKDEQTTIVKKLELEKFSHVGCEGAEDIVIVSCTGDIQPCPQLSQLTAGTLKEGSLQSFWNSQLFLDFRKNKYTYPESCVDCSFVEACRGGCQAYKINSGSPVSEKDPRCALFEEIRRKKNG
jgi:radical SAM protein with 4Fe4S-binding SPASM domain